MTTHISDVFGDIISSYSRTRAIEDGQLIDVSEVAREAGFKWPTVVTAAVWAMIDAAEAFGLEQYPDHDAIQTATVKLQQAIADAEIQRQYWLRRNGYGRYGGRR
jgi:hypothetical protein